MKLFDESQMIRRKEADQAKFEEDLYPELPKLSRLIHESFEMYKIEGTNRSPNYRNRNWDSNTINSNIQGKMISEYGDRIKFDNGRMYLNLGEYIIFFKKLEKNFRPQNIKTKNSEKLFNQLALPMEEPTPIVWIGYQTDKDYSEITGIYAISLTGDDINWISDLTMERTLVNVEFKTNTDSDVSRVRIKKIKKKSS